ncbi:heterokaryon incompatibility protein-domain-containing protein [Annulohypoxylon maeteangense]|uniref:heterokaryon incompatibility protein-domain-containing protein n=1 Tax=Annulohypoxylon maeteangense TaxID=1927788 RepID=UPI002008B0E5|nr:heterokaryon incompatibility protein-domain-containing protein [Annulohypoxylon maeteangense]KAI0884831.1 heterokaryon incompatibility protein-domain-containing protein [Annulohypoxylon maeteangense]
MRLINTRDYRMEEFFGDQIPIYAILSHTWEKGEVTFQDWQNIDSSSIRKKPGFKKIKAACRQAVTDELDWLWVDTNCIDKSSSAELTEAINSMFVWYRDAEVCYAYLQDVPSTGLRNGKIMSSFEKSRWFSRGWTLQELLAPKQVIFYTEDWMRIGSKAGSLISKIAAITGIDEMYLDGSMNLSASSVAKRLSWVADRKTTRVEDIAYCLLGIFDINMPLLYGEGIKAFTRLQHEIIKSSSDHTIFCWTWNDDVPSDWVSMLAPSPKHFSDSGEFVRKSGVTRLKPYSTTNVGLSIQLPVVYSCRIIYAILDVGKESGEHYEYVAIPLRAVRSRNQFDRCYFPEAPILIDRPLLSGRHKHSGGSSGEHLIVRSIHDGPGQSPTSLQLSRYNMLILVDFESLFLHNKGKSLSSTSRTEYFELGIRDFGFGPARDAVEATAMIGLTKIADEPSIYATVARIRNTKTQYSADILFVVKEGSRGASFSNWICQISPNRHRGSNEESSSETLKKSVLKTIEIFKERAMFTQTRDIAEDATWCVKLGGTVLANDNSEIRIVRICNGQDFYDEENFGNETMSDADAVESSIAISKAKVKGMMKLHNFS